MTDKINKEKMGYTNEFLLKNQHKEKLLTEEKNRFVILPISKEYEDIWKLYKDHESAFWKPEEIDYTADLKDWENLSEEERFFIEHILAFFAGSDGIVLENLLTNFGSEVKISEVRAFYGFQTMIENVHSLTYARLIETLVTDKKKQEKLFNAIETIPVVTKKAEWAMKWMDAKKQSFAIRLVAFAIVEGIFFSGAFCSIFWLKDNHKMIKALGHSNELISRDEGLHCQAAVMLYKKLKYKPEPSAIYEIVEEAVNLEKEFITEAIPCDMIGMNAKKMSSYVEFVADRLLLQLGYNEFFGSKNPFDFMANLSLDGQTNFFESRVSEYRMGAHGGVKDDAFDLDDDF
jgi:ribonucleoside-diphosphate reductase beta chain